MIGVDTFSWQKLILLRNSNWNHLIEDLFSQVSFFITAEGEKEFIHRFKGDLDILDKITKVPVLNEKLSEFINLGYDSNDASLLEYTEIYGSRIITEDRPMIVEGITKKKNVIFLIDFFYELYERDNFLTSREFYHLVKLFRRWRNIKEKKAKILLKTR